MGSARQSSGFESFKMCDKHQQMSLRQCALINLYEIPHRTVLQNVFVIIQSLMLTAEGAVEE